MTEAEPISKEYAETREFYVEEIKQEGNENLAETLENTTREKVATDAFIEGLEDVFPEYKSELQAFQEDVEDLQNQGSFDVGDEFKDKDIHVQASIFAEHLVDEEGIRPVELGRGTEKRTEIWAFNPDSLTWQQDSQNDKARTIAKDQLPREIIRNRFRSELKEDILDHPSINFEDMGLSEEEIAVKDGVLNLQNLELRDIEKSDYLLNKLPVNFERPEKFADDFEELGCPTWGEFLREAVPEEKQRKKLQEFVGYGLMHWTTKYEKALMILGPTDSGKGVFLNTVEHLFGSENVCNHSLQYLANKMWGRQDLAANMANIRHDLDTDMIAKMGKAKEIVSGNPMEAAKKRQDPVKIQPRAKHLYSANNPPERKIEDEAFYNRWLTVIFPNSVSPEDQDKQLVEKITGFRSNGEKSKEYEGELPGIFNWALTGLKRLQENEGRFTGQIAPNATRQLWQEYGSSVENFKEEYMIKESGSKVPTRAAYEAYEMYAEVEGFEVEGHNGFTRQINQDPEIRKGPRNIEGSHYSWTEGIDEDDVRKQCFIGIRLKSGAKDELKELTGGEDLF